MHGWFIAPTKIDGNGADPAKAPDVVNNSWGCVEVSAAGLQDTLRASRAAGIFYAVSAGNDGVGGPSPAAGCSTIYHPLARYPEAFTVGATTWDTDSIAEFSSRGRSARRPTGPAAAAKAGHQRAGRGHPVGGAGDRFDLPRPQRDEHGRSARCGAGRADHLRQPGARRQRRPHRGHHRADGRRPKPSNEGCGLDTPTQVPNNTYGWGRIDALAAVQLAAQPDLVVSGMTASNNKARAGEKVTISATVKNVGTEGAPATTTELRLDGTTVLKLAATPPLGVGQSATVSVDLDTPGMKDEHSVQATADKLDDADELDETNNLGLLSFTIKGNKVSNPSFTQPNTAGTGPRAGRARTRRPARRAGAAAAPRSRAPAAASSPRARRAGRGDPIAVTAGEALDFVVSVRASGLVGAQPVSSISVRWDRSCRRCGWSRRR